MAPTETADKPIPEPAPPECGSEVVVLVHGLMMVGPVMKPLEWRLRRAGFGVVNWTYWSTRENIEKHGERLHRTLTELNADPAVTKIHLVTHSMGGIVTRAALARGKPAKLGRIVMLAPPNRGSYLARWLAPIFGGIMRPFRELSTGEGSYVRGAPLLDGVDFAVIAARWDFLVQRESTHLAGERAHLVLNGFHTPLVLQASTAERAARYLKTGKFS
ncbi:MAG: esterase/lipase family protein [Pirellulales bacterium]